MVGTSTDPAEFEHTWCQLRHRRRRSVYPWLLEQVSVVAILLFALIAREFPVLAVLVALLGGLAGLLYLVTRARRTPPLLAEEEQGKHERFLRDIPPPSG